MSLCHHLVPKVELEVAVNSSGLAASLVGYVIGIVGGYLLSRRVVRRMTGYSFQPRFVVWLGVVGGFIALLPAFFLAMVVGGSVGGGIGTQMDETFGLNGAGALIGLLIGVAVVLTLVLAIGVATGVGIGRLVRRMDSYTQQI
jgi:hypothetical protein